MDIRTRLAQAMHHIMSAKATGSAFPEAQQLSEAQLAKSTQLALDQFAKTRTDFVKQMGVYTQQSENLKSLALLLQSGGNSAKDMMRDLSRLISEGIGRNFAALFSQQQSEAYISALLIQSFGMLDKKLKVLRRKKRDKEENDKGEKSKRQSEKENSPSEGQIQVELVNAEQACLNVLEGLLTHAENHLDDEAFIGWAKKSVELTRQQLAAQNIPISESLSQQFSVLNDVIIALENGMSVGEVRRIIRLGEF
jgi:HEPN domain-containing protein